MLEAKIEQLTAAIEALNANLETLVASVAVATEKAPKKARAEKTAAPVAPVEKVAEPVSPLAEKIAEKIADPAANVVADPAPSISKENLKAMALSISRADMNAKPLIYEILGKYNAKTITALPDDPDALYDVFTGFTKIANKIAKDSE